MRTMMGMSNGMEQQHQAQAEGQVVAAELAYLLKRLFDTLGQVPRLVECIGFSAGGNICSLLAKHFSKGATDDQKFNVVTGLDSSSACYQQQQGGSPSSPDDAHAVFQFHTDRNGLGYPTNIALFDVYPNNGTHQPRCPQGTRQMGGGMMNPDSMCDHLSATYYYSAYLAPTTDCQVVAYSCDSYANFENGECTYCNIRNRGCVLANPHPLVGLPVSRACRVWASSRWLIGNSSRPVSSSLPASGLIPGHLLCGS